MFWVWPWHPSRIHWPLLRGAGHCTRATQLSRMAVSIQEASQRPPQAAKARLLNTSGNSSRRFPSSFPKRPIDALRRPAPDPKHLCHWLQVLCRIGRGLSDPLIQSSAHWRRPSLLPGTTESKQAAPCSAPGCILLNARGRESHLEEDQAGTLLSPSPTALNWENWVEPKGCEIYDR